MINWITLHRKLRQWEWYKDSQMVHLFIHLLLSANHQNNNWQGISIKRGQLITGRKSLAKDTGISQQSIRTCLNRLKSTSELTIKSTNKYSIITLIKYDEYQLDQTKLTSKSTSKLTNNQPATNQQLTTNNNDNNVNNDNNTTNVVVKPIYGNEDINSCKEYFEKQLGSSLDGNQKENRNYCQLLLKRFKKDYPSKSAAELIQRLIDFGMTDDFHAKNVTNFKYLYYNAGKIIQSTKMKLNKSNKYQVAKI